MFPYVPPTILLTGVTLKVLIVYSARFSTSFSVT